MVNYPHKLKIKSKLAHPGSKTTVNFANRGMSFEKMINESNNYYLSRGLAVIHKKPTPIQIVKVDYPQRSRAKIVEAYFRQASTTDYSGVFKGHYIDFEAKETRQKTANIWRLSFSKKESALSYCTSLACGRLIYFRHLISLHFIRWIKVENPFLCLTLKNMDF